MMKKILLYFTLILFVACETDIDIELPEYQNKLVVEGYIENDEYAKVVITKSLPYFSTINFETLFTDLIVNDAKVTITSGKGESEVLEFTIDPESPLYFSYQGRSLKGECNESYTLTIEWNDKIFTANTSIPETFDLDSIWIEHFVETDTLGSVRMILTDNPAKRDYYQFKVKIHHGEKLRDRLWAYCLPLVFDDATFNGINFTYEIVRASPSTLHATLLSDEEKETYYRSHFEVGDTILIKHSLMDHDSYRFWITAMNEITFGQNVFMSPPPIQSNIKCNTGEKVLGVWCGFASKTDVLIFSK